MKHKKYLDVWIFMIAIP